MKNEKNLLTKYRFWLLLALELPLVLFALFWLVTTVGGQIEVKRKLVTDAFTRFKQFSGEKSQKWVTVAENKAKAYKDLETVVWERAWNDQKNLMTWPEKFEQEFHFKDGLFAISIKADRRKTSPEEPPKEHPKEEGNTGEGKTAPPSGISNFAGTVVKVFVDYIDVESKDKKTKKRIYRTNGAAVTISTEEKADEPKHFRDLEVGDGVVVTYEQGRYFGDELTDSQKDRFIKTYRDQLHAILKIVNPMTKTGEGVVQLRGWFYNENEMPPPDTRFFNYVGGVDVLWKDNVELSKEAWIAQEDLWIQREIYRVIRLANDYVARFKGEAKDAKDQWADFSNPYWRLALKVRPDNKLEIKATNLRPQRQKLDVTFLVRVTKNGPPVSITLEGEPLLPGDTRTFNTDGKDKKLALPPTVTATGIYGVEQVLTWETAPVKRIDQVCIGGTPEAGTVAGPGYGGGKAGPSPSGQQAGPAIGIAHSHRTFVKGLQAFPFSSSGKKTGEGSDMKTDLTTMGEEPMGSKQGPVENLLSENKLYWKRYVEITPQARRVPIGVVLIVDQEHVSRVQTAFSDMALRFLPTQVLLHRYPHTLRPPELTGPESGQPGQFPFPGKEGPPMSQGGQPKLTGSLAAMEERESNCELVVYGIVSLYERYPPRQATTRTE